MVPEPVASPPAAEMGVLKTPCSCRVVVKRTFFEVEECCLPEGARPRFYTDTFIDYNTAEMCASILALGKESTAAKEVTKSEEALHATSGVDDEEDAGESPTTSSNERTTLMLRNLPFSCTRDELLELLDERGFVGMYNFVYLPVDFHRHAGLGYAFVNMSTHENAEACKTRLDGYDAWKSRSVRGSCLVNWSHPHQGFDAHVERYRNSPVMHEAIPDEYKPAVFDKGQRVAFPAPSKHVRAPRVRRGRKKLRFEEALSATRST